MHRPLVRTAIVVALFQAFNAHSAAAQDEAAVIVTATRFANVDPRVPANVTVITREDIRNAPALDLPDVLKTHAGIDVRPIYGSLGIDATVDLRGFGDTAASNTLILLDGQRLNPIDMSSIGWSVIPLESIRRIEIIRGAGTVLYGDRASGGVINIITDKSGQPRASLAASAGSYGLRGADAYGAVGNDAGYANVFAHYATADGWRRNNQQDQQSLSGRVGLYVEAGEIALDYAGYKESNGLPNYLLPAAYRSDPRSTRSPFDTQRRDGYRLRPGVKLRLSDTATLEAEIADERGSFDWHNVSLFGTSDSHRESRTQSFTPRLRLDHGLAGLPSETVLGIDHYVGRVDSRYTTFASQWAKQTSSAVYFQNSTSFTPAWTVTLGARHQRVEQDAHQDAYAPYGYPAVDGRSVRSRDAYDLGASYRGQGWRAYGKVGSTFRFANADELFGYNNLLFIPVFAGDLRPQHGTIREVGGSVGERDVKLRASLYRMDLTDEIGYDGSAGNNVNFDPTRRDGLEAELDWRYSERVETRLSYTREQARFRSGIYAGSRVPMVPRNKGSAQLTWNAGAAGRYSIVANVVGDRIYSSDYANAQGKLDGYATVDLQGEWKSKPLTFTARLLNAFDKRYAAVAGFASYLVPPSSFYYPADGRTLVVAARYDFK